MKRRPLLPIVLALLTFVLLTLALWPQEEPTTALVVAGRDLGAGAILSAADLNTITVPVDQAPGDGVVDPILLVGKSLSVVRYAGEPVTPRHLGPAVILAPDERGIAVRVAADTGLAGLLRPGMLVDVVATLPASSPSSDVGGGLGTGTDAIFAKSTLRDLRVLYVPPSFQARSPQSSLSGEDGSYVPPNSGEPADRGVIVLAAGTLPEPILFEEAEDLVRRSIEGEGADVSEGANGAEGEEPTVVWAVPVELLAGLNASDAAFTLVLAPENAQPYTSPGITTAEVEMKNEE